MHEKTRKLNTVHRHAIVKNQSGFMTMAAHVRGAWLHPCSLLAAQVFVEYRNENRIASAIEVCAKVQDALAAAAKDYSMVFRVNNVPNKRVGKVLVLSSTA